MRIVTIRPEYARDIAALHIRNINTGFISSLGIDFLTALYEAIAESSLGFGFVVKENDKVLGFVAFTTNLNKLYKSFILKKGVQFVFLLSGKMFSLRRLKNMFETLFYPNRVKRMDLPDAELLSIVVVSEERGKGLATALVRDGLSECAQRGIKKVKVLVGADNKPANKLYIRCGFELMGQIKSHGVTSNIYAAQVGSV